MRTTPRQGLRAWLTITPLSLTLASLCCVAVLAFAELPFLEIMEFKTYDLRLLSRPVKQPSPAVVLALIDEKSLGTEGRWPWPRSKLAALVTTLSQYGVRVIGMDIGFLEPELNPHTAFLQDFHQQVAALGLGSPQLNQVLQQSQERIDNDRALAQAIKTSSAPVVLGYFFHQNAADLGQRLDASALEQQFQHISGSKYPFVIYATPASRDVPLIQAYAPESNIGILTEAAAASGFFSLRSDQDGAVRWMPLIMQSREELYPPLSLLCAWHYLRKPRLVVHIGEYGAEGIQMGERLLPTDATGRLLINYLGPPKTFPHLSISDILSQQLPLEALRDKIVLIGATATGTYDARSTPMSTVYPGVEIHATVIDNILSHDFLSRSQWARWYDLCALLLLGAVLGSILPRLGALRGLVVALCLCGLHVLAARWLLLEYRVWVSTIYPLLSLGTTYLALTVYAYVTTERERQHIKDAFAHYVPPRVVNELLRHPELLRLGGEERVLSVLFSDVESFTTIAESMSPTQLVLLLNEYLSAMTDIVLQHNGIIDKYEGDAIMAEFGAPVMLANHADMAVKTALLMQKRLAALRQDWSRRGLPLLRCRVGINTGAMVVGNMGSQQVFDYTVMGDAVNLASRLESANKLYHTYVMISEFTYEALSSGLFHTRLLDVIQVKGKSKAVKVFEVYGEASEVIPDQAYYQAYHQGFTAYLGQDFTAALQHFQRACSLRPDDVAAPMMLERIHALDIATLPADWDGALVLTSK